MGWVAVAAGSLLSTRIGPGDLPTAAAAFWLVLLGDLRLVSRAHPAGNLAPPGAYLLVFGLFHGGLVLAAAIGGRHGSVVPLAAGWIDGNALPHAIRLAILGMVAFTTATLLVRRRVAAAPEGDEAAAAEDLRSATIGAAGLVLLGFGLLAMASTVGTLVSGGYASLYGGAASGPVVAWGIQFIGIGACCAVVGTPPQRRLGLLAFGGFALFALPFGLRGPVLFAAVAVLVVESRRGLRIRPLVGVATALALLLGIGAIREARLVGPGALVHADWLHSPLDAVAELGYSIYPTVVVWTWHDQGEPFRGGDTLTATPVRFVESLTGTATLAPEEDDRLFNIEVGRRVGGIGGSPVAEGYHNFGAPGVVLLLGVIGAIVGLLDRRRSTARHDAILGVVLLPLLVNIRNATTGVPIQILVGLLVVTAAALVPVRSRAERAIAARHGSGPA